MASPPPAVPRFSWRDWMPITATIMALIGAIIFIGGVLNDVKQSKADIADLKAHQQQLEERYDQKLSDISVTTARTDATLQALRDRNGDIRP